MGRGVGVLVLALLLAGCGDGAGRAGSVEATAPVTDRALAWVATQHLHRTVGHAGRADDADQLGRGSVGADVVLDRGPEGPADRLTVRVGPAPGPDVITGCPERLDGCVRVGDARLQWQEEEPEEDPGEVVVVVQKGEDVVVVSQSTQTVTGDPRRQDLEISVEEMLAVARDPRVARTTTAEALEGGAGLRQWRGPSSGAGTAPPAPRESSDG